MNFLSRDLSRQKIAVIGGGISGMASAYLLSKEHNVTLFEAGQRLGGHARTVLAGKNNDQPVDTGFIVFNYVNYPHLTRLFKDLNVPVERSDMSFGVSIDNGRIEYGLQNLMALIGQKRNLARPAFYRMVRDILHFNAHAESMAHDDTITIGELIKKLQLGEWFQNYYLLPVCGAIWSTPSTSISDFPAKSLVRFFRNHALLSATGQHQWWTVKGGSTQYVKRLAGQLHKQDCILRVSAAVQQVKRTQGGVTVSTAGHEPERFDHVVMACHSDEALELLEQPTADEASALGAIRYQDNHMFLHCDEGQMPKRRSCWSSWVYRAHTNRPETAIGVTYWMNRLQNICDNDPLFVSLNPADEVRPGTIYDQTVFRHPVFDQAALRAQTTIKSIQGQNNTWYAGAYLRHGFHEDGYASAVRVAKGLTETCPA